METAMQLTRFLYDAMPEPASALLIALLLFAWYILRRAEVPDGYWAGVFKDADNKVSALRVSVLISLAVSSAVILYFAMNQVKNEAEFNALLPYYITYLATWSGAPVLAKLIDALSAKWSK